MELQFSFRYLLILALFGFFCYQMRTAIKQIMSQETVDSTEYIQISDLNPPPAITFCPRQALNFLNAEEMGLGSDEASVITNMLQGKYKQKTVNS